MPLIPFSAGNESAFQIRYVRDPHGLYYVKLLGVGQEIVCQPRFFVGVSGADPRCVLGSIEVTRNQALALGFIVPVEELATA